MNCYTTEFSGKILERGFWLYVWRIQSPVKLVWYVGRTGDNSSPNASSPFGRLSQHLDLRTSATANMLARNLLRVGIEPEQCHFRLLTIGPLFPEQNTFEEHLPFRDSTALIEAELAHYLTKQGLEVIGTHPPRGNFNLELFTEVLGETIKFIGG
jgi:hypothetical protein